ncbi:MAG: hypothetical protein EOL87_08110 [Spartobacteria bacterium]|nr:hypothetical protein [Spartobacteria bacterium]
MFDQTQGQPWLVNAVAREMVMELGANDPGVALTLAMAKQAVKNIILRRETHIDILLEWLKEPRVQHVVEPMVLGESDKYDPLSDEIQYVTDLGLIRSDRGRIYPANPIYAEVIGRTLSFRSQYRMDAERLPYVLQRIINGGGHIVREFATGRKRMDLIVELGTFRYPVEIKLWRGPKTVEEGLAQLDGYLDTLGLNEGWLVIFDRRPDVPWDEKIRQHDVTTDAWRMIHLFEM